MTAVAAISLWDMWSAYLDIAVLMFTAFLIGYLASLQLNSTKYRRRIKKLKKELESLGRESSRDIDVIYTEIEPKILETIERKTKEAAKAKVSTPTPTLKTTTYTEPARPTVEPTRSKTQAEVANRASETFKKAREKKELNFDNFGYASESDKDDLTQITGVGPYIEQKLNEIGIYSYDQISRFNWEDIQTVTEMIDFFPGRMERDNWVGQAERLKNY